VIGSAGSDDKVQWLQNELSFDHAFNYKTADPKAELAKFDPLNIYFDNVGGVQLEAALDAAADHARFIECGMISRYNTPGAHGIRNLMLVVAERLKLQGFIILDKAKDESFNKEFYSKVPKWIANGELKIKEDVTKGLEYAAEALVGIFEGKNFGKAVIQITNN
jgi:NADPH-dependent curcumin reductase CurA